MDYNKIRNLLLGYLNGLGIAYITLGIDNVVSYIEELFPNAAYSEFFNIVEGSPIGHGAVLFVLNDQKQLIGLKVYNASKIWVNTTKEAAMVYGVPYKRLEQYSDGSWLVFLQ